jgi:hypothetical protein
VTGISFLYELKSLNYRIFTKLYKKQRWTLDLLHDHDHDLHALEDIAGVDELMTILVQSQIQMEAIELPIADGLESVWIP